MFPFLTLSISKVWKGKNITTKKWGKKYRQSTLRREIYVAFASLTWDGVEDIMNVNVVERFIHTIKTDNGRKEQDQDEHHDKKVFRERLKRYD